MKRRNKNIESPPDDIPEIIGGDWRSRILTFAKCVKELDEAQKDDEDEDEGGTGHGRMAERRGYRRERPVGFYDSVEFPRFDDESLLKALGRKWRICIKELYLLVRMYESHVSDKHISTFQFCLTSKRLNEVYENVKGVRIVVGMAQRCGLILCVEDDWKYGTGGDWDYGKLYAWNRDCADQIVRLARKHQLTSRLPRSVSMKRIVKNHDKLVMSARKKGDPSEIQISQRTSLSTDWTDDEVVAALRENYPQLKWAQDTAIRLNERLRDDEQISVFPNIQRTHTRISKIGFRVSNPLVSLKTKEGKGSDRKWRSDYLNERFGEGKWVGYDVKSSIYRVQWLVVHGEWLDNSIDFYQRMVGFDFPSAEDRDNYKHGLAMKLFFENSPKTLTTHLMRKGMDRATIFNYKQTVKIAWDKMRDFIGEPIKSVIFLHEGCIYLEAFRRMVEDRGWEVVQVYDGFYIRRDGRNGDDVIREAASIVEQSAYWYQRTFLSGENQDAPILITGLDKGALQQ